MSNRADTSPRSLYSSCTLEMSHNNVHIDPEKHPMPWYPYTTTLPNNSLECGGKY
jgi:hypothetical protein